MQVCTSLQTDNHASTPPLSFLQAVLPSCRPTNSVRALKVLCSAALWWINFCFLGVGHGTSVRCIVAAGGWHRSTTSWPSTMRWDVSFHFCWTHCIFVCIAWQKQLYKYPCDVWCSSCCWTIQSLNLIFFIFIDHDYSSLGIETRGRRSRFRLAWWRGTVVERRSLAGELSLSCARPAADGWPLMWVSHPL